ncbi:tRNA (adenine(58)-N(1))-methyltransferase non-catalytic subunit TRM6 [Harpegnathos saltator]|uniref:tRNA (adenine(58)-N(1))-methyltransferase non-catalytic subunit TRM6 n=1 Tax=Harpegnathos saltator TaxID=610380 RepID=E2BEK2_HARSA|nr:tRNA (adenine(58)-N(1))-methyltransferase non-catalytic subunit TRM6 [Harpegnathos saltator]EFN85892.1 tRNA (adenine-N(1)-)-methyltransferase non-catalytic subunit TRM6 [Harpegnathos saltator]
MSEAAENTCENKDDLITIGTYVIIKKQNYSKVYKVSENATQYGTRNSTLMLGKDQVEMREIIGKPFWSTFEMVPSQNGNRTFTLKLTEQTESWDDLKGDLSGQDNRSITDDGTSQKLSKEEIVQLQETGKTGKEIIGSLIENSKSFAAKTEYSQEKYIKKKERKYFKFLTVCKPTVMSLHEVYFRLSQDKIGGLRMDALAQILSYSNVQSDGLHMLYDSGSQGLPAAAMLERIGANTSGHLINLHPGNTPQTAIVQAMNFPQELKDRHVTVNIYSLLRLYHQGESSVLDIIASKNSVGNQIKKQENSKEMIEEASKETDLASNLSTKDTELEDTTKTDVALVTNEECTNTLKRKIDELEDVVPAKKPKWFFETQRAMNLLNASKALGLTVIAKEHPANIVSALLPFLGISRPFVIFHMHREPLQETYIELKQKYNVINLRLFTNFLRSYQVLPDRTHPNILMSDTGGYILTGYLVE